MRYSLAVFSLSTLASFGLSLVEEAVKKETVCHFLRIEMKQRERVTGREEGREKKEKRKQV